MPYNTRRKSLSLPSLGIQLPHSSRTHRPSNLKHSVEPSSPPSKRVKRSPSETSATNTPAHHHATLSTASERPKSRSRPYEHTPPPSPGASGEIPKVDTEGINDDIVTAVIEQLEKTGNRPHLIKELAQVLGSINDSVASSANPAALLSSRLSAYLKRPWTALAPCPIAKELIPVHPRKVFFYLTTSPHQELPDNSDDILPPAAPRVISPSLSSESIDQDEEANRERQTMSPSPEVDLSSPEFDDFDGDSPGGPPTPGSFSGIPSLNSNPTEQQLSQNSRHSQCALEGDEVDFQYTANSMQTRSFTSQSDSRMNESNESDPIANPELDEQGMSITAESDETPEMSERRNKEAADVLFGSNLNMNHGVVMSSQSSIGGSSPMVKAKDMQLSIDVTGKKLELSSKEDTMMMVGDSGMYSLGGGMWDLKSPETVELEELDDMFGEF
ncbi:MAG: hypothetical protein M1834_000628 [Cirrosporium novae-zelandiae]|nr:MAG: hypothetical protein M1834_000628 [Cirrosporium novae-zelandiae]